MFLEPAQVRQLTGRARRAGQIQQLRLMGIPFYVNALGEPVVACSAVEGRQQREPDQKPAAPWSPAALHGR